MRSHYAELQDITGVYILAGKPASPHPSQRGAEPKGGRGRSSRDASIATLYVLVVLSFIAWGLLFALAVNFLRDNINASATYWLGVTDQQEEGTWLWTNGERPRISFWNTWKGTQDKEQKDCGTIGPGGIWNAARCSHSNRWICEKSWNC
ncbi:hypothetical protein AAES_49556 [Amazona aestiva]|uniref:C-type lectin domain-containing protein n=1 Tax=Amazona aestiva TaxID=12930 RepID=A0A0Q3TU91_AMAAE|nr:hypothetical protein AAES_49556 [Amazona aestiva]